MRTESQATLIGLARKIEAGTSVTPMSIARALEQALLEQAKYQAGSNAAFDAMRLVDAIHNYRRSA